MKKLAKILSFLFFPVLLALIFYIAFSVDYEQPYKISVIEINGGKHLANEKYFAYAGLEDKSNYEELTLPVIKNRLEKHPYVKRADVLYAGEGKVQVEITEKDFWAILITGEREFVLTKDFETLPVLKYSQQMYYPIISDNALAGKIHDFDYVKNITELKPAFKLLDAAKVINPKLYDNLSEIAYDSANDLSVFFTFSDYELLIEKKRPVAELYYFNALWKYLESNPVSENIDYIDLRYKGKIFLGMKENVNEGNDI